MADQADKLRALAAEMKGKRPSKRQAARAVAPEALPLQPRARVLAVSSGKGGVGKTNLAVNLGIALCRLGKRAVVFDADLGLANADLLLGLQPRYNLTHFFQGGRSLAEIMCDGPEGLKLIPTGSGIAQLADLSSQERERVLSHFALIEEQTDFLIVDTGAGISRNVMAFAHASEEVLVVTTPEPTARLDAYGLVKVLSQEGYQGRLRLIVNMAESKAEGEEVSKLMQSLALRFLNIHVEPLGVVPRDRGVPASVRQQRPFVVAAPNSAATAAVERMAGALAQVGAGSPAGGFIGFLDRLGAALRR